jgi:hypothetical protein
MKHKYIYSEVHTQPVSWQLLGWDHDADSYQSTDLLLNPFEKQQYMRHRLDAIRVGLPTCIEFGNVQLKVCDDRENMPKLPVCFR